MDCIDLPSFPGSAADRSWYEITTKRLTYRTDMMVNNVMSLVLHIGRNIMAMKPVAVCYCQWDLS